MGRISWAFTPGAANVFADWASRNPAQRDLIIPVDEDEEQLYEPKSLMEAFVAAAASQGVPVRMVLTGKYGPGLTVQEIELTDENDQRVGPKSGQKASA